MPWPVAARGSTTRSTAGISLGDPFNYTNEEAAALVAAMSVEPDDTHKGAIDDLYTALKSSPGLSAFDLFYVLAAHDEQASRLNWISPGTFTLTATVGNGTGELPTFTTDVGWVGNPDGYLDSGWLANTDRVVLTTAASHIGGWLHATPGASNGNSWIHMNELNQGHHIIPYALTTPDRMAITATGVGNALYAITPAAGHYCGVRHSAVAGEAEGYLNGTSLGSVAHTEQTGYQEERNFKILHNNVDDNRTCRGAHIGGDLSDAEVAAIHTALAAYMAVLDA